MVLAFTIILYAINGTVSSLYLLLASVFAAEFKYRNLDSYFYGYIIGAYAFSSIFWTFWLEWLIKKIGRSMIIMIGMILMTIWIACMGLITYIEDNMTMFAVAVLLRICHGIWRVFIQIPSISILVILYPEQQLKYVGYMESLLNIGSAIGPALGSVLYNLFGYLFMFLIMAFIILIFIPLFWIFKTPNIDRENEKPILDQEEDSSNRQISKISLLKLFMDPLICLLSITTFINSFCFTYYEPVLSFRVHEFTNSVYVEGIVFTLLVLGYGFMAIFVNYFTKCIDSSKMIFMGSFSCGLWNFLIGPSTLLPNSLILICIGLYFSGTSLVFAHVPLIPMMIK